VLHDEIFTGTACESNLIGKLFSSSALDPIATAKVEEPIDLLGLGPLKIGRVCGCIGCNLQYFASILHGGDERVSNECFKFRIDPKEAENE
jgi:hypothetical protein